MRSKSSAKIQQGGNSGISLTAWILISIGIIILLGVVGFVIYKMNATCPTGFVCLTQNSYDKTIANSQQRTAIPQQTLQVHQVQNRQDRDRQVLTDPLYPPLNRTDRGTFDSVVRETNNRNINISTKDIGDSYRLVGYLVNKDTQKDAGGNSWKLFAREKDRNESDYYIVPTNKDFDVKVPLTPEIFVGQRFKDTYSLPKEAQFKSPLLNATSYEFIELPKSSFADSYN